MRRNINTRITPLRSKHTPSMSRTYASPRLTQTLGVAAQISTLIHRYMLKRVVPTRCDMTLFMHWNMLAAAWNNSWKLVAYNTTLGHALARLSTWCKPSCTRRGNGPQWGSPAERSGTPRREPLEPPQSRRGSAIGPLGTSEA
jgi:hypothetical protein